MTLRVGCNLLWLVPGAVGGSETATVHLLRTVASDPPPDIELTLYGLDAFGHAYPELTKAFPTKLVPLTGRLKPLRVAAENTWLPREVRGKVDIMHHMGGVVPMSPGAPCLVTLHDLQPFDLPDNFSPAKRIYLQRSIPNTVRRAHLVLTASEFVRRAVIERFGVPFDRVRVTPWGVGPPSSEVSLAEVQARYGLPRRWFVYPAFTWWHKDHALAVKAFATLAAREHDVVLVLTGGEGPAEQSVMELVDSLGLRGRVRRTGLIPRRDVLAIVRGATALLYPSRYEGFGLPVAEAMSLGTPVLAADATALPEVVGDAGWLLPPGRIDDWSEAMARMLVDGDERRRMGQAGQARAARYSWAANADATVTSYRDVAAMLDLKRDTESLGETPLDRASPDDTSLDDTVAPDPKTPDDNGVAT